MHSLSHARSTQAPALAWDTNDGMFGSAQVAQYGSTTEITGTLGGRRASSAPCCVSGLLRDSVKCVRAWR